jgi:2-polyprenyl-3-methyl-5-hydroxy-6-metoxy-1,4-benzoquinol methylase
MAYEDFIAMVAERTGRTPEDLLSEKPLSFRVSSNIRGQALVDSIRATLRLKLEGLRVLDVGCAYGGFSVALAEAGARVTGVDLSSRFLKYAAANAKGVAEIPLIKADASSVAIRKTFAPGSFDMIVLNDVLEHIYDTASLFDNLDYLLSKNGLVYFKVPNGLSPRWALSEGHRKVFGLSLMDPDAWQYLYPKPASIYYRPLSHFQALFQWFDLPHVTFVDNERRLERCTSARLNADIEKVELAAKALAHDDKVAMNYIRRCVRQYRQRFDFDLQERGEDYVRFTYGTNFFIGYASRKRLKFMTTTRTLDGVGPVVAAPLEKDTA